MSRPIEPRLWSKVDRSGGPLACWPWLAGKSHDGYGQFYVSEDARHTYAHRVAFEFADGPVPAGHELDHLCHTQSDCAGGHSCPHRACCNPAHLEPVTRAENHRRGRVGFATGALNRAKTHCPAGHPYAGPHLRVLPDGRRECRTCRNYRKKLKRLAA